MPPKAKITKEMIIEAGLKTVRKEGAGSLNVRQVAAELACSTQPVMYHFKTVCDLKAAVYEAADKLHTEYIMSAVSDSENPFLSIGLRYIQFAEDEKNIFRFLFQSNKFQNVSFAELMRIDDLMPVIASLCGAANISESQAHNAFEVIFACVHGIAGLIANNSIKYDKAHFEKMLITVFNGVIAVLKGETS